MPQFFNLKNLTPEQKENWEKAIVQYKSVQEKNSNIAFDALTEAEKDALKQNYKISNEKELKELFLNLSNNGGHEKSALFFRLLDGKKPLVYAPPTALSYPWYSIIESNEINHINIFEDIFTLDSLIKNGGINIYQTHWQVLKKVSDTEALITYKNWNKLGFVWRFYSTLVSCKETIGFILSYHNPKLGRITTLEELEQEQLFHVKKKYNNIQLVLDEKYFEQEKKKDIEKYGVGLGSSTIESAKEAALELLNERRSKGLNDYPSDEEIQEQAQKLVQRYLDSDIVVKDGLLYQKTWVLEKVKSSDNIYMD